VMKISRLSRQAQGGIVKGVSKQQARTAESAPVFLLAPVLPVVAAQVLVASKNIRGPRRSGRWLLLLLFLIFLAPSARQCIWLLQNIPSVHYSGC
jgi:hypothetical protein